jgi:hypothetical protein
MLFKETVEFIVRLKRNGQNAEFYYVKAGGTYGNHCYLKA